MKELVLRLDPLLCGDNSDLKNIMVDFTALVNEKTQIPTPGKLEGLSSVGCTKDAASGMRR